MSAIVCKDVGSPIGLSTSDNRSSKGTGATSEATVNDTIAAATRRVACTLGDRPSGKTSGSASTSTSQPNPRHAVPSTPTSTAPVDSGLSVSVVTPQASNPSPVPHAAAPQQHEPPDRVTRPGELDGGAHDGVRRHRQHDHQVVECRA